MRILWLSHEYPEFPSAAHRAWNYLLLRELAKRHQITYVPLGHYPKSAVDYLGDLGIHQYGSEKAKKVQGLVQRFLRKLSLKGYALSSPNLLYSWGMNATQNWSAELAAIPPDSFDLAIVDHTAFAPILDAVNPQITKVIVVANIERFSVMNEPANNFVERIRKEYAVNWVTRADIQALRKTDLAICMTERDKDWVVTTTGVDSVCLPVSTDCDYFASPVDPIDLGIGPWLALTGSFNHAPNDDAACYFITEILPVIRKKFPEAGFVAAGMAPSSRLKAFAAADAKILVTGFVPDIRPYLAAADVYVAPLRFGAGIKVKMMEVFSMGKPIVATSAACEGMNVVNWQQLVIADDPDVFADGVCRILSDAQLQKTLTDSSKEFGVQFDYKTRVADLEKAYADALERKRKVVN